ncbi:Plant UBX domain-containing protein 11 [Linum grandiflorum]
MESCISELAYKGSISQAILESKAQKKLFVVYISGKNSETEELEKSTWTDVKVAEALSKYCILLHVLEGTEDAINFSAIYPQKSVPAIAVIGYNGVQLWQSEGFVSAEVLVSNLEKAYLSLHIQETTANVMTAALADNKSEPPASGSSNGVPLAHESSSAVVSSSPAERNVQSAEVTQHSPSRDNKFHDTKAKDDEIVSPQPLSIEKSLRIEGEQSQTSTERTEVMSNPSKKNSETIDHVSSDAENNHALPEVMSNPSKKNSETIDHVSSDAENNHALPEDSIDNISCVSEQATPLKDDVQDQSKVTASNDVHLNIKLLNGTSIKEKFLVSSTMRMVRDFVDNHPENDSISYDLANPYPRKVFGDQDLDRSLSDLGLSSRQALIVVPRQGGASRHKQDSSSTATTPAAASIGGYFGYVRRALSVINPLSYVGASNSSTSEPVQSSMWQYSPNPAPQNSLGSAANQQDEAAGTNNVGKKQPTTTFGSGSNIHTLRQNEDDDRVDGRNTFWNGNSTQYGGSDNDAKP